MTFPPTYTCYWKCSPTACTSKPADTFGTAVAAMESPLDYSTVHTHSHRHSAALEELGHGHTGKMHCAPLNFSLLGIQSGILGVDRLLRKAASFQWKTSQDPGEHYKSVPSCPACIQKTFVAPVLLEERSRELCCHQAHPSRHAETAVLSEMHQQPWGKGWARSCVTDCSGVAGKLEEESDSINASSLSWEEKGPLLVTHQLSKQMLSGTFDLANKTAVTSATVKAILFPLLLTYPPQVLWYASRFTNNNNNN